MAGTTVYYNGVCLQDCLTSDFEHVIEYDESGYQAIANRFRITVESTIVSYHDLGSETARPEKFHPSTVVNVSDLTGTIGSSVKLLGTDTLAEIQSRLNQNCMDFVMTVHDSATNDIYYPGPDPEPAPDTTQHPKGYFQRNGSHRILLAGTGISKKSVAGVGETKLVIYDPNINAVDFTEIDILRQDVLDCDNGPKPMNISVGPLAGSRVFRVSISFEICRPIVSLSDSDEETLSYDPRTAKGVMKNRWSVSDSIDEKGAVTHRIRGTLAVSDIRYKANAMRLMAFPLAFPFARLAGRENEVSEDGKTLGYTIAFKHAGNAPPLGVRDYEAKYTEEASIGTKSGYFGSMHINVKGWYHRSTDNPAILVTDQQQKYLLLRGAITLLYSRIRGINSLWNPLPGQNPSNVLLRQFKVVENTKEPELDLFCAVQFQDSDGDRKEFPARLASLGAPINIAGYDPKWWPIDNEWGRLLNEDVNNIFLRSTFIPKSGEGAAGDIDYMNQQRHKSGEWAYMTPRITQLPKASGDNRTHTPTSTSGTTPTSPGSISPETILTTPNPLPVGTAFTAYVSQDLKGYTVLSTLAPRSASSVGMQTGISDVQQSGFSYLTWHSETLNETSSGLVQLPLSSPRVTPISQLGFIPAVGESVTAKQTAVVVRLHAGASKRIYSVTAERIGDWPEMPKPTPIIVRRKTTVPYPGSPDSSSVVTNIERLLNFEFMPEFHDVAMDGCTNLYKIHARYEYALDMPVAASEDQNGISGGSIFSSSISAGKLDLIPVVRSPILKTTFEQSGIQNPSLVFSKGYIEPIS